MSFATECKHRVNSVIEYRFTTCLYLRVTLEKKGKPLSNLDLLIAAQAISVKAILVTADQAFYQVKDLSVCDWSQL